MQRDNANFVDVLDTVHEQQRQILNTMDVLTAADSDEERVQPFAEVKVRLRQLMDAEENVVYPRIAEIGEDESTAVDAALTEHDTIEAAIVDLETSITVPKITTLSTAVNTHFNNERTALFAAARTLNGNIKHELAMRTGDSLQTSTLT